MDSEGLKYLKQLLISAVKVEAAVGTSPCNCCGALVVSDDNYKSWRYTKGINLANTNHVMHTGDNWYSSEKQLPDHPKVVVKHVNLKDIIGVDLQYTIAIQQEFVGEHAEDQEAPYVRKST